MKYTLTLKSHTDAPDYVHSVQANSKDEAVIKLVHGLTEWTEKEIEKFVEEEN